jgi:hypothetical protein
VRAQMKLNCTDCGSLGRRNCQFIFFGLLSSRLSIRSGLHVGFASGSNRALQAGATRLHAEHVASSSFSLCHSCRFSAVLPHREGPSRHNLKHAFTQHSSQHPDGASHTPCDLRLHCCSSQTREQRPSDKYSNFDIEEGCKDVSPTSISYSTGMRCTLLPL